MKNIAFIGMMGSGKSTIGKKLSELLSDYSFVDTDELIVQHENMSINDIFAQEGEEYFRNIETEILKQTLHNKKQIISTGGGIILKEENRTLLKKNSIVIYLQASSNTLFERVKNNKDRPLLNVENMKSKIGNLLGQRKELYENCSTYIINTEEKTIESILKEIEGIIKNHG